MAVITALTLCPVVITH